MVDHCPFPLSPGHEATNWEQKMFNREENRPAS